MALIHDEEDVRRVLGVVLPRLGHDTLEGLCLVGSSATVLHGVNSPVGDIDFLAKERYVVDAFAKALGGYPCLTPPTLLHGGIQYFAAVEVDGIRVEASTVEIEAQAETLEVTGIGPWKHQSLIRIGESMAPTIALELRLASELSRDRQDRYLSIVKYFASHGETSLLNAVLQEQGLESKYLEVKAQIA